MLTDVLEDNDFLVVVGYWRATLDGRVETYAKAVHARSSDPVTAGEQVLDEVISGPPYAFSSIHARVLDYRTGVVLRELHLSAGKPFGVRRAATLSRWACPDDDQTDDGKGQR